jgi:type IV secretory pathway protease TraF
MTKAFELARFVCKPIVAALALFGIASATVQAQHALSDGVAITYWKSQETSTPLPAGFIQIHMDNQKIGSALTASWRGYAPVTTGSVTGRPIATEDINGSQCAPGQLVVNFDTRNLACDWAIAE